MEGTAVCTIVQFGPTPLNGSSVELGVITKCSNSEGSLSWMRKSGVTNTYDAANDLSSSQTFSSVLDHSMRPLSLLQSRKSPASLT